MTGRSAGRGKRSDRDGQKPGPGRTGLGDFLRAQRRIAGLTLRQLANITSVSNAYLSQIERNLHKPSVDVLRAVARGLNVSAETLLDQVGLFEDPEPRLGDPPLRPASPARGRPDTEAAILTDPALNASQREALLAVYRSYVAGDRAPDPVDAEEPDPT